jgi:hypothetical protein
MPILYVNDENKKELEENMIAVLESAHDDIDAIKDVSNRMKPLDVVKVLMGIHSNRECVKRF